MSGKAKAVMWIGFLLILLNLSLNWKQFTSLIFTAPSGSSASGSGGSGGSGTNLSPLIPLIPGLGGGIV
jgi:hypothetical protein